MPLIPSRVQEFMDMHIKLSSDGFLLLFSFIVGHSGKRMIRGRMPDGVYVCVYIDNGDGTMMMERNSGFGPGNTRHMHRSTDVLSI